MFLIEEFSVIVFSFLHFHLLYKCYLNRVQRKTSSIPKLLSINTFPTFFLYSHSLLSCLSCLLFFPFMIVKMKNPTLCEQLFLHLEATGFTFFFIYSYTEHLYYHQQQLGSSSQYTYTVHKYIYYVMFVDVFKGVDFYYP